MECLTCEQTELFETHMVIIIKIKKLEYDLYHICGNWDTKLTDTVLELREAKLAGMLIIKV